MAANDGMNYAPTGKPAPVVKPGEFVFAATALDHGHIYGQCNGLIEAGGTLKWVYDPEPAKVEKFLKTYPQAKAARSEAEILDDREVRLVAAAAVPSLRAPLGIRALRAGKDYFTDKTPMTTLRQLDEAKAAARETKKKYMVYYSERLHVECAVFAGQLIEQGAVGRVLNVIGTGPHRLGTGRPDWFFRKEQYGGILCDIGSHQAEQFLSYAGAKDARVVSSRVANYANAKTPELEDFGDCTMVADNGATSYYRVDWFTPNGLRTWGDGRCVIMGSEGYIELRKYIDPTREARGDHLFLVNAKGEQYIDCAGKVGFPFFGRLIRDCLDRSETAMTQEHAFKAAELCLKAQEQATRITP
jgi:predicted dehydrogenase